MSNIELLCEKLKSDLPAERNAAAIELMDIGNPEAVPLLISAIERPENRTARGSLIYALSAFDCAGQFSRLFTWAAEGGYEATAESLSIINEQGLRPSPDDLPGCEDILASLRIHGTNGQLIDELEELLRGTMR